MNDESRETISLLVAQLFVGTTESKEVVLETLGSLVGNNNKVAILVQEGAIEPLMQLIQLGSENAQQTASQILMVISLHEPSQVIQQGAAKPLVQLLSSKSPKVREYVTGILGNLAQKGHSKEVIEAGAVKYLVQLLQDDSDIIQHKAASALGFMACHADNRADITKEKAIKSLVKLLSSGSPNVKEVATFALLQLSFFHKKNIRDIYDAGALKPLVDILSSGVSTEITKSNSENVLYFLSLLHSSSVASEIIKAEITPESISQYDLQELVSTRVEKQLRRTISKIKNKNTSQSDISPHSLSSEYSFSSLPVTANSGGLTKSPKTGWFKRMFKDKSKKQLLNEMDQEFASLPTTSPNSTSHPYPSSPTSVTNSPPSTTTSSSSQVYESSVSSQEPICGSCSDEWEFTLHNSINMVEAITRELKPIFSGYSVHVVSHTDQAPEFNSSVEKAKNKFFVSNLQVEGREALRHDVLSRLENHEAVVPAYRGSRVKVLRVWYSVPSKKVTGIIEKGFANSEEIMEEGWFGKGIYFALSPSHSLQQRKEVVDPCLLMCYVIVVNPFPVIWDDAKSDEHLKFSGKTSYKSYDCLFVPVTGNERHHLRPPQHLKKAGSDILVVFQEQNVFIHSQLYLSRRPVIPSLNLNALSFPDPVQAITTTTTTSTTTTTTTISSAISKSQEIDNSSEPNSPVSSILASSTNSDASNISPDSLLNILDTTSELISPKKPQFSRNSPQSTTALMHDFKILDTKPELRTSILARSIELVLPPTAALRINTQGGEKYLCSPRSFSIALKDLKFHYTLATGGQGSVILADWKNIQVVVKRLRITIGTTGSERAIFKRELDAWMDATHENCVSMYGIVDQGSFFGFVAEYCQQGSLNMKFQQGIVLSGKHAVEIAKNISAAISALHTKRIAHRDIKSANIMIDGRFRAKLGDFGLSRLLNSIGGVVTAVAGTLTHMAPEQIESTGYINPFKADVYGFGILMYELALSLELKFRNPEKDMNTPNCLPSEAREKWWDIAADCSGKDPDSRPTMHEVHERLAALAELLNSSYHCAKHRVPEHDVYISYNAHTDEEELQRALEVINKDSGWPIRVFLNTECMPNEGDWDKCILHGLHNSKVLVPIISPTSWDSLKNANHQKSCLLQEYENMLDRVQFSFSKIFPWIIGGSPNVTEFPDALHFGSKRSIRSTLDSLLRYQGILHHNKEELQHVALMVAAKLNEKVDNKETQRSRKLNALPPKSPSSDENQDVGIVVEGQIQPISMVSININLFVSDLRDAIIQDGEILFPFKFIARTVKAPLSATLESTKKIVELMDDLRLIVIRQIET